MTIVVMAGGKGTRIASVDSSIPKPMIRICGKPILEYQISCFVKQGYTDLIFVIGHLGHVIRNYFGDGSAFGVHIRYIEETEPLGTAGALYYLKNVIDDDFFLVNGDIIFDLDIDRFYKCHRQNGKMVTIFTHPNDHPQDSTLIDVDALGHVTQWISKEDHRGWLRNCVNAGLHFVSPRLLDTFVEAKKTDLDREILRPLIARHELYSYRSPEYVKDMGTPERLYDVERDIQNGMLAKKSLLNRQSAVFLDRDGTINRYVGFLNKIDDFVLKDGVDEYIRSINRSGYLAIVVTNQPVIARGDLSWDELSEIHKKMETLLGQSGAYLDDIFVCPHHPDRGFPGERIEYKIDCQCRKPKPGLLLQAAKKYNIDLSQSYMIGDSETDMLAGEAVGCTCVRIEADKPYILPTIE